MCRIKYLVAIAATALSLGAFAAGATAVQPEGFGPGCEDGYVCAWDLPDFNTFVNKWKVGPQPGLWHLDDGPAYSAKNRFGNRKVQLLKADGSVVACLDAGEGRPDPGSFRFFLIGEAGSHCNN